MPSQSTLKNLSVGFLFLGSLAIVGGATLLVSKIPLFRKVEAVEIRFSDVDNLKPGDDVLLHGFQVGQVDDILYDPDEYPRTPILVRCIIPADIAKTLGTGVSYTIHSSGPLGGRYVEILPPTPPKGEGKRPERVGEAPGDVFKQLEALMQKHEATISDTLDRIHSIAAEIDVGRGLLGQLIEDPVLAADFAATIAEARDIVHDINVGKGPIGALVNDEGMREKLSDILYDVADFTSSLKTEKGIVGFLINNEQAKKDLQGAIDDLGGILDDVRQGDGIASRLIRDGKLASEVEEAVANLKDILEKVNTGQGTLGQIINNQKAWDELVKVLVLARETIEDIREQAPISTFVNALFATF